MSSQTRFADPAYTAWLRDSLSLLYLKEGMEDITSAVANKFHNDIKRVLGGRTCTSSCLPENMIKDMYRNMWYMNCPVCDAWLQQIVQNHTHTQKKQKNKQKNLPNIHSANTNPRLWPTDPWEVLKCYMGYGCQGIHYAKDLDAQNMLTLLKNCQRFSACGQIGRMDLVGGRPGDDGLLEIRNSLYHSGDHLVLEAKLQKDIRIMLEFLAGVTPHSPVESRAVADAVSKITELQNNKVDLSLASNKDLELRALQQKQIALDLKQKELDQKQQELKQETDDSIRSFQTEQHKQKTQLQQWKIENDAAVKTIQTEMKRESDAAYKTLQTEQQNIKRESDAAVKTLQNEQQEMKRESDAAYKTLEAEMKQNQSNQDQFMRFLQANNLDLSRRVEQCERRITNLEQQSQRNQEATCEMTEDEIKSLQSELIKHYTGGQSLLVPNPVVDEALDLDEIYVRPGIEVLRETSNPRAGLKVLKDNKKPDYQWSFMETLHTSPHLGSTSMCKNLFYTEHYQNKQIYVAGNAGVGKTVLCKYLVNLWCQTQSDHQSGSSSNKQTVEMRSTRQEYEPNQETSQLLDLSSRPGTPNHAPSTASEDNIIDTRSLSRQEEENQGTCQNMDPNTKQCLLNSVLSTALDQSTDKMENGSESEIDMSDYSDFILFSDSEELIQFELRKWTERMKQEEEEDRIMMAEFPLVFYISLRESSKLYTVTDMIDTQILKQIRGLSHLKAADILQNSRCLVIVDGLDEWTCPDDATIPPFINPGIPGRDLNSNSVFLTTTRPWKLEVLGLKGLEIDKHVELCGLNETSSRLLCSKYIDFVNKLDGTNKQAQTFSTELKKKGLERFHNVPNLLILLIGLWMDNQDLGQSRLQLFCGMLEMLLKRAAEKNLPQQSTNDSDSTDRLLPECFNIHPHCLMHQHLLAHLCKVAFEALLDPKREEALVINSSQFTIFGVYPEGLDLCLKSGILTQDKVLGKRSVKEKKISFLHKQLQEVLAAVYISNRENAKHVTSRIYDFCTTVESVLELSQVWMFLSGINPDLTRKLLTDLMTRVVSNDDQLQQYRCKMFGISDFLNRTGLPKPIQRCIVDCVMEARSNGHEDLCLPLYDLFVNEDTISSCLEHLVTANKSSIKSVYIDTRGITSDNKETFTCILTQLQHTSCVQSLYLMDYKRSDMSLLHKLLVNNKDTLKRLDLRRSITLSTGFRMELCGTLPTKLYTLTTEFNTAVCDLLHHLTSLTLFGVKLTHKQGEQLLLSVSQAGGMRELKLRLRCTDHDIQCRAVIDLSGHTQLHILELVGYMCVDKLPEVTPCVEKVNLGQVTIAESQLRHFIHQLSSSSHRVQVYLYNVTVTVESENPVDLTDLTHNKKFLLSCDHSNNTWSTVFSTLQQPTSELDN